MFCSKCGKQLNDTERFCSVCGQPTGAVPPVPPPQSGRSAGTPLKYPSPVAILWYLLFFAIFAGSLYLLIKAGIPLLWAFGTVGVFAIFGLFLYIGTRHGMKGTSGLILCGIPAVLVALALGLNALGWLGWSSPGTESSSVVSVGVARDDLGNILNGQYYFDDGTAVYYSTFDTASTAHIYRKDMKTGTVTSIFDGFGWSLVVNKGWLYFSGNAGTVIDGTYHLFRMKTDGTGIETLDSNYCYGMSFYDGWLYYVTREGDNTLSIVRSSLDGKSRKTLLTNTYGCGVVYLDKLYYLDDSSGLNVAAPDGTGATPLLSTKVRRFVIGNGKIFYADTDGALWKSDIDGKNPVKLRDPGDKPILALNSYKDTVFFADYDSTYLQDRYGYQYYLHSIKEDGTGEKDLYSAVSQSCWMNLVGGRLYVLDYALDTASNSMPAIVREMPLGGGTVTDLPVS